MDRIIHLTDDSPVAALSIDKVGQALFVRALARAPTLGREAKKVKYVWSTVLLS